MSVSLLHCHVTSNVYSAHFGDANFSLLYVVILCVRQVVLVIVGWVGFMLVLQLLLFQGRSLLVCVRNLRAVAKVDKRQVEGRPMVSFIEQW